MTAEFASKSGRIPSPARRLPASPCSRSLISDSLAVANDDDRHFLVLFAGIQKHVAQAFASGMTLGVGIDGDGFHRVAGLKLSLASEVLIDPQ